ncbi:hypothetical protein DMUE_0130 [Dictyocoela muelleri]|nr:hypothetical protein DMUE_0130 [Dictyocoela muelleri]
MTDIHGDALIQNAVHIKNIFHYEKIVFFENFNISLKIIFKVILFYISKMPRYSIINSFIIEKNTVHKIIRKIVEKIPYPDFSDNKLGGEGNIVQIDETMLNLKVKSHRGRSPQNKTDALVIIEYNDVIKRVFACTINAKTEEYIVPIICSQVASNSTIWTDEHGAYHNLKDFNYDHDTVIHKYKFIN